MTERSSRPVLVPVAAAILSLCFAGMGHLIVGQYVRAIAFLVPNYFIYSISDYWPPGMLVNVVCFIIAAVDAFSFGRRGFGIF